MQKMLKIANFILGCNLAFGSELSFLKDDSDTRLFTIEVDRHCERQSEYEFPLAKDPAQEFKVPYNCTDVGVIHQNLNGLAFRLYLKDFLKFRYDENEVYTQTSYKQRTIDSAIA